MSETTVTAPERVMVGGTVWTRERDGVDTPIGYQVAVDIGREVPEGKAQKKAREAAAVAA